MTAEAAVDLWDLDWPFVERTDVTLRPDPARVIAKMFIPGRELLIRGDSRATPVLARLLALPEEQVVAELEQTRARFAGRHLDFDRILTDRFDQIAHRLDQVEGLSDPRRMLIGAYFTMEYSVEAAALFNPSMVVHPDQSGVPEGCVRFVMSLRAVGEGHVSSIEFRTGLVDPEGWVSVDDPGPHTVLPETVPARYAKEVFAQHYGHRRPDGESAQYVLDRLPDFFGRAELDDALEQLRQQTLTRGPVLNTIERFEWMAASTYSITFPPDSQLAQRVIHPIGPAERLGLEDVRLVARVGPGRRPEYWGTYTAFSGDRVAPQLLRTDDFCTFHMSQLAGTAAQNKGMAIFPRLVAGRALALSRWDRENISLAESPDGLLWEPVATVGEPTAPWELVQLGNCGSPIETDAGWLVLTHGVGPVRQYAIGAMLLDREDPARVLATLSRPLLWPDEAERVGYVPNVVYSCGGMRHGQWLVLPYGCSDSSIRVARVHLPGLLAELLA